MSAGITSIDIDIVSGNLDDATIATNDFILNRDE